MSVEIDLLPLSHAEGLNLPSYSTVDSSGLDLPAAVSEDIILKPLERAIIPTGFKIALPSGCEGQVRPRSGLAAKHGVTVLNTPGTIDADYRGEIKVILINLGQQDFIISRGMRIAQMVIAKVEKAIINAEMVALSETERGERGFGSTGILAHEPV
jgi:dUTP diphosphatase